MANLVPCAQRRCGENCLHGISGIHSGENDRCEVPANKQGYYFTVYRGSRCRHTDESYQRGLEVMNRRRTRNKPVVESIH